MRHIACILTAIVTMGQPYPWDKGLYTRNLPNRRSTPAAQQKPSWLASMMQCLWFYGLVYFWKLKEWRYLIISDNIVYQDNQSTMLLAKNGRQSSRKSTRHLELRYYFVTDNICRDCFSVVQLRNWLETSSPNHCRVHCSTNFGHLSWTWSMIFLLSKRK